MSKDALIFSVIWFVQGSCDWLDAPRRSFVIEAVRLHRPAPWLRDCYRIDRAPGRAREIPIMIRAPTAAIDATAHCAPIIDDNAPNSMAPMVSTTWLMWKIAMVRPRKSAGEEDWITLSTTAGGCTL